MAILKLDDGSLYEGEVVDGKPHGKGKQILTNGSIYEGDFADGKRHGKGKMAYPGRVEEGEWKDGFREYSRAEKDEMYARQGAPI